ESLRAEEVLLTSGTTQSHVPWNRSKEMVSTELEDFENGFATAVSSAKSQDIERQNGTTENNNDVTPVTNMLRTTPSGPIIRDIHTSNNRSIEFSNQSSATQSNNQSNLSPDDFLIYKIFDLGRKIAVPLSFILGVPGNILNIIILRKQNLESSTPSSMNIILICLAVSDIVILVVGTPRYLLAHLLNYDYTDHFTWGCRMFKFLNYTFSDLSCWLVMLIAFERSIATGWPHKVKIWCSHCKTIVMIIFLVLFLACANSHFLYCFGIIPLMTNHTEQSQDCGVSNESCYYYSLYIFPWVDFALFACIPGFFVVFGNVFVLQQVYSAAHNRKHTLSFRVTQKAKGVTKMTIVMFAISFFLLLSVIPTIAYQFCYSAFNDDLDDLDKYVTVKVIGNFSISVYYMNTVINFVLYIICSQRFKDGFKSLFSCSGPRATRHHGC
ncbi:unnamed protein product, partial [Owenia fusiformis]